MIQNTIKELQIDKIEKSLNTIDLILQSPISMFIIGIVIGIALTYLISKLLLQKRGVHQVEFHKNSKSSEDNFSGLFQNLSKSNECKELYRKLLIKAHPDNFSGSNKEKKALDISKELGKQRHNYIELKKLDKLIDMELK